MGIDTKAFIKSDLNGIFNFITTCIDSNALLEHTRDPEYNIINFNYINEKRRLNVHKLDFDGIFVEKDEERYFKKYGVRGESSSILLYNRGLPDRTKGISISLGQWGNSILICDILCSYFGGWVNEFDTIDEYREGRSRRMVMKYILGEVSYV